MPRVTIVDYGLANMRSVRNAFEYFGAEVETAESGDALDGAERIVLPGVGSFDAGIRGLRERGLDRALSQSVFAAKVPYFGICLGMQFLLEGSAEGREPGLGWIEGQCMRFPDSNGTLAVPHIGWNDVAMSDNSAMFAGIESPSDFYFVHSYFVPRTDVTNPLATAICDYGGPYVAALERDNIWACQFHPEKSQMAGMKIIENFLTRERPTS